MLILNAAPGSTGLSTCVPVEQVSRQSPDLFFLDDSMKALQAAQRVAFRPTSPVRQLTLAEVYRLAQRRCFAMIPQDHNPNRRRFLRKLTSFGTAIGASDLFTRRLAAEEPFDSLPASALGATLSES
jgi:hypothetical protein